MKIKSLTEEQLKNEGIQLKAEMIKKIEGILSEKISRNEIRNWHKKVSSRYKTEGDYGIYPPLSITEGYNIFINLAYILEKDPLDENQPFLRKVDLEDYLLGLKGFTPPEKGALRKILVHEMQGFQNTYCFGFTMENSIINQLGIRLNRWIEDYSEYREFAQLELGSTRFNLTRNLHTPDSISLSLEEYNPETLGEIIESLKINTDLLVWKSSFLKL